MKNIVRKQATRMAVVHLLLASLVVWQKHFIWGGIQSNPYLNAIIIGVFGFGAILAIRSLLGLRNDVKAFAALKDVYDDIQAERHSASADHDARKLQRCAVPGIVYASPQLLGHVFTLTLDELLRTRHMRISIATMQHLIAAIDARMAHQRSLMGYLTGLSVFLGLIGTFIGLMEMVGSVGGIIGGLAKGDSASPESIKRLIHDLEAPLVGMATGFSCSLFGLFGSLTLGLLGRFVNTAADAMKHEFEDWLAGISQIETARAEAPTGQQDAEAGRLSAGAQAVLAAAIRQSVDSMDLATVGLRRVVERQDYHAELIERTCRLLDRAAQNDNAALEALHRTDALQAEIARMREDLLRHTEGLRQGFMRGFEQLGRVAREHHGSAMRSMVELGAAQTEGTILLRRIHEHNDAKPDERLVSGMIAHAVATGVGDLASALNSAVQEIGLEVARLTEEQRRTTAAVGAPGSGELALEIRALSRTLQEGIGDGLADMARTFDSAFKSYAAIVSNVVDQAEEAALARKAEAPAQRSA
jgi:hypothetical protein